LPGDDRPIPLCVDLDGTLVRTDTLHEALIGMARGAPLHLVALPLMVARGKAQFKHWVASHSVPDPAALPYRQDVLDLIAEARAEGRPVILATATARPVAEAIAAHLGIFDGVIGTGDGVNLSGANKADALATRFGERGFDYVGDHVVDLPVLARARRGYLVTGSGRLVGAARSTGADITHIADEKGGVKAWIKACRVHQWLKNLLVFVPLVAGHKAADMGIALQALLAFVAFSLCASSVYITNDLLDLAADRAHARKRKRPFASGALLIAAAAITVLLPPLFALSLLLYYIATSAYSFRLKRQVIVDVVMLAGLYTMRILAGAAATGIVPSFWLLALSMFVFLSLAMVKRYSELIVMPEKDELAGGRGYRQRDLPVVMNIGSSSGMIGVLILAMYTQSPIVAVNYPAPEWLWLMPPLGMYWIARIWMKAHRMEVHHDPIVFAARDWQSLVVAGLSAIVFLLASLGVRPW